MFRVCIIWRIDSLYHQMFESSCSSPKVMPHDVLSNMFSSRQYLGEMLGRGLGVTQLYLVLGDLTGDWTFAVVAFISKDF